MANKHHQPEFRDALEGDEEAHARIFEAATNRVLLYIRLRMGSGLRRQMESLDILQEAFVVAQRDLAKSGIRDLGSYLSWLCRIADNRIKQKIEYLGAKKRRPEKRLVSDYSFGHKTDSRNLGPDALAEEIERREMIARAIDEEPTPCKEALLARFFEGKTIDVVAQEMKLSPSAVRRMLGESAIRLSAYLKDFGDVS